MKITAWFLASALTMALVVGSPRIAEATFHHYDGYMCSSSLPATSAIGYSSSRTYNAAASGITAVCSAMAGEDASSVDLTQAYVHTYDGATSEVSCLWEGISYAGTSYYSSTLYSCGTVGGCASSSASWSGGDGYLGWTNPLNGGNVITDLLRLRASCSLPPTSNVGIRSYQTNW